jgi:hypothetical protein
MPRPLHILNALTYREKAKHYEEACQKIGHDPNDTEGFVSKVEALVSREAELKLLIEKEQKN